jgi:hypothetical protein
MLILVQIASLCPSPVDLNRPTRSLGALLLFVYLLLFFWQEIYAGLNPTELLYRWNTKPGLLMLMLRLVAYIGFLLNGLLSCVHHADRRHFLAVFLISYSAWFLVLPFMVCVMAYAPYTLQWKVVLGVSETVEFLLYAFFLVLAIPNPIATRINGISFFVTSRVPAIKGEVNFRSQFNPGFEGDDDL